MSEAQGVSADYLHASTVLIFAVSRVYKKPLRGRGRLLVLREVGSRGFSASMRLPYSPSDAVPSMLLTLESC